MAEPYCNSIMFCERVLFTDMSLGCAQDQQRLVRVEHVWLSHRTAA